LASAITNVADLTDAYRTVVDAYALKRVDFDLSGAALGDRDATERRWQAIHALQREIAGEGGRLEVWLTLPATRAGLTSDARAAVESALRNHVDLGGVNLKTSDLGEKDAPDGDDKAGLFTIEAAINAFYQLRGDLGQGAWSKIGITPTIGRGDASAETFRQKDARDVRSFAEQQGVGMIGMWSLNRDQQTAAQPSVPGPTASGVEQAPFEFSEIFRPFTGRLSQ
jgi:chitinase